MLLPQRSRRPEIMDGGLFTSAELEENLSDLRLYDRVTGGHAAIAGAFSRMIRGCPPGSDVSILDVGAGGGDVARALSSWLHRRGHRPAVVASDLNDAFLRHGAVPASGSREAPGGLTPRFCAADAASLPFRDGAFDLACSSLVLHHLDDPTVAASLAEMRRVTRRGFVALDLRRSWISLGLIWTLTRITTRNRLTLHDGPLSVRRSFTVPELRGLALEALDGDRGGRCEVRRQGSARLLIAFEHDGRGGGEA